MVRGPRILVEIRSADGKLLSYTDRNLPKLLSYTDRGLVDALIANVKARGVGVFRTEAAVEAAIRDALADVVADAERGAL